MYTPGISKLIPYNINPLIKNEPKPNVNTMNLKETFKVDPDNVPEDITWDFVNKNKAYFLEYL